MELRINPTHDAADAFWEAWKLNGDTHKHGYYESTWIAINAAIMAGGLRQIEGDCSFEFTGSYPNIRLMADGYLLTKRDGSIRYLGVIESIAHKLFGFYPKDAFGDAN